MKQVQSVDRGISTSAGCKSQRANFRSGVLFAIGLLALPFLVGCGNSGNDFSALERDLRQTMARFENAEANFSSSATYDQLIVNAGWLDRMAKEVAAIERIEARAVSMGAAPIPEVRDELAQRFRRRFAAFQSDAEYLDVMSQLEIARIWSEI